MGRKRRKEIKMREGGRAGRKKETERKKEREREKER